MISPLAPFHCVVAFIVSIFFTYILISSIMDVSSNKGKQNTLNIIGLIFLVFCTVLMYSAFLYLLSDILSDSKPFFNNSSSYGIKKNWSR